MNSHDTNRPALVPLKKAPCAHAASCGPVHLYQQLFEKSPTPILLAHLGGELFSANPAACQALGRSEADILRGGRSLVFVDDEARRAAFAEQLAHGAACAVLSLMRADGSSFPAEVRSQLLWAGESPFVYVFFRDLTEERRAADALRASEEAARAKSAELERALEFARRTEEKLRHAQKMESVGRLAGGVAHDFNNLLTVVLANNEELAYSLGEGHDLQVEVGEIKKAAQRASALTQQLLAFSRQQVLAPRTLDVNALIRGVEPMLRRLIGEDVVLDLRLAPETFACRIDPGQFEQTVMNLAVNARDAMPEGGRIEIATSIVELGDDFVAEHPESHRGPHVCIRVSDNGTGMSDEVRARVFEPFFTTKEVGRGTGLGLSTAYGIVRQSSGTITVESELGRGTTFSMLFPRAVLQAAEARPVSTRLRAVGGTESLLLVEDDAQVRAALASTLENAGYRVLKASSPGEALLIYEQSNAAIQLVLTDVVMPHLSGRKLAERLEKIRSDVRVLFMSGYNEDSVLQDAVVQQTLDFLAKPITPAALLGKVREVLDR